MGIDIDDSLLDFESLKESRARLDELRTKIMADEFERVSRAV